MKIAVLYSGQFRYLDVCYENHASQIYEPMKKEGHDVKIFASLHKGEKEEQYCRNWLTKSEFEKFELIDVQASNIAAYSHLNAFPNFENWLKQIISIQQSFQLLNERYDFVIRIRTDLLISGIIEQVQSLEIDCMYIPNHDNWYGYNDRFAIGGFDIMKIHSNFCEGLKISNFGGQNAESYFKSYIDQQKIPVKRTNIRVSRLRHNGYIEEPHDN